MALGASTFDATGFARGAGAGAGAATWSGPVVACGAFVRLFFGPEAGDESESDTMSSVQDGADSRDQWFSLETADDVALDMDSLEDEDDTDDAE